MPVTADRASVASYAQFPAELDRDWLGRVCHLSGADLAVIRHRADPVTRLGYAAQLVTVRVIGTFQPDPAAVPEPVVAAIARQLGIDDPGVLAGYRDMPVRWRHTAGIRYRYGYRDFSAQPDRFAFTVWLYRQAWDRAGGPGAGRDRGLASPLGSRTGSWRLLTLADGQLRPLPPHAAGQVTQTARGRWRIGPEAGNRE